MRPILFRVWRALGHINLTIALCFLLTADLGLGYLSLRDNLEIFAPMSDVGLLEWLHTYGRANPAYALWFFAMLGLLAGLAVNTFACTTERLRQILAGKLQYGDLPFRLAPHLMHYAVLIILSGYLCSYLFSASETGRAVRAGEHIELAGGELTLSFKGFAPEYQEGSRIAAFDGFILKANAQVTVRHAGGEEAAVLNFNEPLSVAGYGIYLAEFQPRRRGGGMGRSYIRLIVRHDPSAAIYRFGMGVFMLGLGLYVFGRQLKR